MAGLLSDGRILALVNFLLCRNACFHVFRRFLQAECASFRWDYKHSVPIHVLNKRIQLSKYFYRNSAIAHKNGIFILNTL